MIIELLRFFLRLNFLDKKLDGILGISCLCVKTNTEKISVITNYIPFHFSMTFFFINEYVIVIEQQINLLKVHRHIFVPSTDRFNQFHLHREAHLSHIRKKTPSSFRAALVVLLG